MDLFYLKCILLLIMIAGTLLAGLLPMKVLKWLRHSAAHASSSQQHKHVSLVLCLLTCFSGGVFLATCFLHLLPEVRENLDVVLHNYEWDTQYPIAELVSCLGFFLIFFLEEVVIMLIPSMAHGHSHGHGGHGHDHEPLNSADTQESGCCMTGTFVPPPPSANDAHSHKDNIYHDGAAVAMLDSSARDTMSDEEVAGHCQKHCPLTVHHVRRSSGRDTPECTASTEVFTAIAVAEPERCEVNCEKVNEDPPILMKSSPHAHSHGVRSITLILALSIHSVIEGIALGVVDSATETTALFISLLVHKLIVAFSVGLQLSRTHAHQLKWVVVSMVTLSVMSPLGALLGMAVTSSPIDDKTKDFVVMVLQGLAVGTFLYVTFFEVLLHERDNEHPNLLKLFVMMLGFGLIGLLRLMDHGHGHGHSHGPDGHDEATTMATNLIATAAESLFTVTNATSLF